MVVLWNRADHYIFALWFLPLSSFFFPRLISAVADWMSAFHTWCGLKANFRCRSEMCCTRLPGNAGCKKIAKNRHLGTITQLSRAISLQLRHVSTMGKQELIRRWDSERELLRSAPHKLQEFAEIMQNNGHYAVQGHSRSPILVPIESSYTISYQCLIVTYLLSCTVSEI